MNLATTSFCLTTLLGISAPSSGVPWIHEVFYDPEGADAPFVFTELGGLPGTSLDGYRLVGIDGGTGSVYREIALSGAFIPADGLLVIAGTAAIGEVLAARDFIANIDWQNGPDAVQLWDSVGAVVDALQYGDAAPFSLGEGAHAPDPLNGLALSRDLFGSDTGDNLTDFQVSAPTPGSGLLLSTPPPVPPPPSVPEPATTLVLAIGFLGLWTAGKCRQVPRRPAAPNPR
jgi:hypothetical protein